MRNNFTSMFSREGVRINNVIANSASSLCMSGSLCRR